DRGKLRSLRTSERYRALRRLSRAVPRVRMSRTSLGAWRLATPAVAGPTRTISHRIASQPAATRGALEALRQPTSQPGPPRAPFTSPFGMDSLARLSLDLDGDRAVDAGAAAHPVLARCDRRLGPQRFPGRIQERPRQHRPAADSGLAG